MEIQHILRIKFEWISDLDKILLEALLHQCTTINLTVNSDRYISKHTCLGWFMNAQINKGTEKYTPPCR